MKKDLNDAYLNHEIENSVAYQSWAERHYCIAGKKPSDTMKGSYDFQKKKIK